jgi:hypothetical protein
MAPPTPTKNITYVYVVISSACFCKSVSANAPNTSEKTNENA